MLLFKPQVSSHIDETLLKWQSTNNSGCINSCVYVLVLTKVWLCGYGIPQYQDDWHSLCI